MNTRHERRRRPARHLLTARKVLGAGLKTMALVSLARQIGPKRLGRAAAVLAGAHLRDLGRRRGPHTRHR